MDFQITDQSEDVGTLVISPGRNDSFEVSGYNDGGITINIPLYSHEAQELRRTLEALERP